MRVEWLVPDNGTDEQSYKNMRDFHPLQNQYTEVASVFKIKFSISTSSSDSLKYLCIIFYVIN